jgi:UDP-4-amino-4,6-dideoxy-N-acetyl-beta-L-altrosamine transaminase
MMPDRFLPYGRQQIEDDDIAAVAAVLRGDFLTSGPAAERFESALAQRVGAADASACGSGTAALHLAMLALGIGPGDVVIVPTLTFLASANAARYTGAEVAFADVDPATGLLTPAGLEEAIARARRSFPQGRLRAVVPVHLTGQVCAMPELRRIAQQHDLFVVEDACHALGTTVATETGDEPVGSCRWSDLACFSFHPVKTVAMGEGGAVTGRDKALVARVHRLRNHGMTRSPDDWSERAQALAPGGEANPWYYEMPEIGFNYRASDIHCALGLSQLGKLDRFVAARRGLAARYDAALPTLAPRATPAPIRPGCQPCLHLYVVQIDFAVLGQSRAAVMQDLRARGIGTQVHYLPVHRQPYYRKRYGLLDLPRADAYYERALSLPLFPAMTPDDVARVTAALDDVLRPPA